LRGKQVENLISTDRVRQKCPGKQKTRPPSGQNSDQYYRSTIACPVKQKRDRAQPRVDEAEPNRGASGHRVDAGCGFEGAALDKNLNRKREDHFPNDKWKMIVSQAMALSLNNLHPAKGSTHRKKLSVAAGTGLGKTSAAVEKRQKSRSGYSMKIGFEGGQMPLHRRLPKRVLPIFSRRSGLKSAWRLWINSCGRR